MLFWLALSSGFGIGLAVGIAIANILEYNSRKLFVDAILAKNYQELQRGRQQEQAAEKVDFVPVPKRDKIMLRTIDGHEVSLDEVM